jgi:preprotein translocase subunit SecB
MGLQGAFMSTTNGGPPPGAVSNDAAEFGVMAQYIKDFSFENPNAPRSLAPLQQQPEIGIQVNVSPKPISNTDFEVELRIDGKAEASGLLLFSFDLTFAGVFRLQNVPQENISPLIMIEAPRLLFPFAREIISSAISSGGFPPLLLNPVDFVALYQKKMTEMQAPAQA